MSKADGTDSIAIGDLEGVTIIGGGDVSFETLGLALSRAPFLVAADGGAATALALGLTPGAIIGDMDSLPDSVRDLLPAGSIHRISEQDSIDLDKCVRMIDAPICVAVGVLGPRLDHGLAALNVAVRNPGKRIVLLTEQEMCFLCPPSIRMTVSVGCRVSLFPIRPVMASSSGLKWELNDLELAPDGKIGTSNQASRSPVTIVSESPGLLAIVPAIEFVSLLSDLRAADTWARNG